ncbi:type II toxin-antitoxin system HicB family antitoxin [Xenophilus azovorans]|uniref:type II toxin-antitoxin system HicB family antitoxin n=1 Tax=Xenophilus azovorans TaxID=151755 RepID=UPI00056FEB68|nr:type II toxin-antitoxin system HicB family antitoxin [Xenophilus azovorans]
MRYQVEVRKDGKGYMASFPDIPEALTAGDTKAEALEMAQDALITALDFYFEDRREVPLPRKVAAGKDCVELPASLVAKVLLLNEMVRQKVRPAELARKLHTSAQDVNRLTNLRHTTKVDALQSALGALGKRLEISLA